jgi:hypothetical protein
MRAAHEAVTDETDIQGFEGHGEESCSRKGKVFETNWPTKMTNASPLVIVIQSVERHAHP